MALAAPVGAGLALSADLAGRFIKNFERFTDNDEGKRLVAAGPQRGELVGRLLALSTSTEEDA